jgi:16S rRNA processing protein RimM
MEFVPIGKLKKTHGLQGEIKLEIEDKFLELLFALGVLFVEQTGSPMPFFIESIRGKGAMIAKLEEVDDKETANALANKVVYLRRTDIPFTDEELAEEESDLLYYYLKDYELLDQEKNRIGKILEVADYPQQEMAIVQTEEGPELLIPLLEDWITVIDTEHKTVQMELPEGLVDL